jgi:hypothetical protein
MPAGMRRTIVVSDGSRTGKDDGAGRRTGLIELSKRLRYARLEEDHTRHEVHSRDPEVRGQQRPSPWKREWWTRPEPTQKVTVRFKPRLSADQLVFLQTRPRNWKLFDSARLRCGLASVAALARGRISDRGAHDAGGFGGESHPARVRCRCVRPDHAASDGGDSDASVDSIRRGWACQHAPTLREPFKLSV